MNHRRFTLYHRGFCEGVASKAGSDTDQAAEQELAQVLERAESSGEECVVQPWYVLPADARFRDDDVSDGNTQQFPAEEYGQAVRSAGGERGLAAGAQIPVSGAASSASVVASVTDAASGAIVPYPSVASAAAALPASERALVGQLDAATLDGQHMQLLEFETAEHLFNEHVQNLDELYRAQVTVAERHTYKRWVIAVVLEVCDAGALRAFAEANGLQGKPFVVGARGPETLIAYQAPESDKHKPKVLVTEAPTELLTFRRTGNQSQRVVSLFRAIFGMCSVVYTNCAFAGTDAAAAVPEREVALDYEGTLAAVLGMRLDKFEALFGDAKLKKSRKQPISDLEHNVLTCFSTLHPIVKLREDSEALLYDLNSEKFTRAAPLPLADGASEYALKHMPVTLWVRGAFRRVTLTEWLDDYCESHSLFLVGRAGAGKSKLLHMVAAAWEGLRPPVQPLRVS
jgi:hypothetical protein